MKVRLQLLQYFGKSDARLLELVKRPVDLFYIIVMN